MTARVALVVAAAWACAAAPLQGQALAPLQQPRLGGVVGRVHVEARPGSPAVGLTLVLPVGSALDPDGREGTARALAGVMVRQVEAALGDQGGLAQLQVTPERTTLTVLAVAEAWPDALAALLDAAFRGPLPAGALAAEVAGLQEVLTFEAGAPILDVRRETRTLLYGPGHPADRPPGGTPPGLAALTAGELTAFRDAHVRAADAALALVGVGDETRALRLLGVPAPAADTAPAMPDSAAPRAGAPTPPDTAPVAAGPAMPSGPGPYEGTLAWAQGNRIRIAQEVTSTWIAVAYPVPADLPLTLLDFITHRLDEELNPTPPDPGLFSARVEVRPAPGGRVLMVEAAVLPDAAERWEARILEAVERLATPADDAFFLWQRRRFRSSALLAEAAPEAASARYAADLLELDGVRDLAPAIWALDAATLAAGVAALGPPRILVYGPDLVGNDF